MTQATKPKVSSLFSQLDLHTERRHLHLDRFVAGTEKYSPQQAFQIDCKISSCSLLILLTVLRTKIQDQEIDQMVKNWEDLYVSVFHSYPTDIACLVP